MKLTIYYFLIFIIYSFLGWLYESILISYREKQLVNRGFLNGPYCPVYGSGAVIVVFFLGEVKNPLIVFILGIILTGFLEYFTSYIMELMFHAKWWDYSNRKVNLNGRVCLLGAFVFGCMSLLVVFILNPLITGILFEMNYKFLYLSSFFLFMSLFADFSLTVNSLIDLNNRLCNIQCAINKYYESVKKKGNKFIIESKIKGSKLFEESKVKKDKIKDNIFILFEDSEYNSAKIKNMISLKKRQDKRIIKAFPYIKSTKYHEALEKFKETMRKNIK